MCKESNIEIKTELPEVMAIEFETRAASMDLLVEEYCYAIIALSLLTSDPFAE